MKLTEEMVGLVHHRIARAAVVRCNKGSLYHVVAPARRPGLLCGREYPVAMYADFHGGRARMCTRCWEGVLQEPLPTLPNHGGTHEPVH